MKIDYSLEPIEVEDSDEVMRVKMKINAIIIKKEYDEKIIEMHPTLSDAYEHYLIMKKLVDTNDFFNKR